MPDDVTPDQEFRKVLETANAKDIGLLAELIAIEAARINLSEDGAPETG